MTTLQIAQAKDTQNEKRNTGGDTFAVRVVSADNKFEGTSRVLDLNNGQYQVYYAAPTPGPYFLHVTYNELGTTDIVPIRGSPFSVICSDPWTKHRVMGSIPARRKGLSLVTMGNELVVYGGDKSGVSVCSTEGADWRWVNVTPQGEAPPDRTLHSCVITNDSAMVIFGGINLADQNDLNDMYMLRKEGDTWIWSHPMESRPYMRHPVADPEMSAAQREGSAEQAAEDAEAVPAEGTEGEGDAEGETTKPTAGEAAEPAEGEEGLEEGGDETEQAPPNLLEPLPVKERNSAAAVAIDRDLYILGGDNGGDFMREFAMCDTNDTESANWMEPILKGDVPRPRKACAAAATGNKIFMFGGLVMDDAGMSSAVGELVVFEITGPNGLHAVINPDAGSTRPAARAYPIMQEYANGKIFLYGGLDAAGKALNDAWLYDVASNTWECVFFGHSDLVLATGSVATLLQGNLVMLNCAAGSPKLDQASSLDFSAQRDALDFVQKMKHVAPMLLEAFEAWVDKQGHAMELAKNMDKLAQNFDSLLKVMDALFQVRIK